MSVLKICTFALLGVCAATVLKQWKGDFLPLLRISLLVGFGVVIISSLSPLIGYLKDLLRQTGINATHAEILIKALGISLLTQCCADICKESGESGAANNLELTGKIEILLLCLPLIHEILEVAQSLLSLGS